MQQSQERPALTVRNVVHDRPVKNTDALANPQALDLYRDLPDLAS